jgi:hypothetical protein
LICRWYSARHLSWRSRKPSLTQSASCTFALPKRRKRRIIMCANWSTRYCPIKNERRNHIRGHWLAHTKVQQCTSLFRLAASIEDLKSRPLVWPRSLGPSVIVLAQVFPLRVCSDALRALFNLFRCLSKDHWLRIQSH